MNGGLTTAELNYLWVALQLNKTVYHAFDLSHGETESRLRVSEAYWAIQVAVAGDFDESRTGMLLVLRAKTTIQWATVSDFSAEPKRGAARLVVRQGLEIHVGV